MRSLLFLFLLFICNTAFAAISPIGEGEIIVENLDANNLQINRDVDNVQVITKHRDIAEIRLKYTQTNWSQLVEDIQNAPDEWADLVDTISSEIQYAYHNINNIMEGNISGPVDGVFFKIIQDLRQAGYSEKDIKSAVLYAMKKYKNRDVNSAFPVKCNSSSSWNPLSWIVPSAMVSTCSFEPDNQLGLTVTMVFLEHVKRSDMPVAVPSDLPPEFEEEYIAMVKESLSKSPIQFEQQPVEYEVMIDDYVEFISSVKDIHNLTPEEESRALVAGLEPEIYDRFVAHPAIAVLVAARVAKRYANAVNIIEQIKYQKAVANLKQSAKDLGVVNTTRPPIWTATLKRTSTRNAYSHWKKHGKQFPELQNSVQYVQATEKFLHKPPSGTLTKIRDNGDIVRYHQKTNTFAVMTEGGVPKTMFKPDDGLSYFNKDRGKLYE